MSSEPTVAELLSELDSPRDGGEWLNRLWPETRAVIAAANKLPINAPAHVRAEADLVLARAITAWRKRAAEVLA